MALLSDSLALNTKPFKNGYASKKECALAPVVGLVFRIGVMKREEWKMEVGISSLLALVSFTFHGRLQNINFYPGYLLMLGQL